MIIKNTFASAVALWALTAGSAKAIKEVAYGPVDCASEVVQRDPDIGEGLLTKLCTRAASAAVPSCYFDAFSVDKDMGRGLAIRLCNAAPSMEPLVCYANIFNIDREMGRGLGIDLCAESVNAKSTINCYVNAAKRGMSRGGAIKLCGARKD